MRGYDYDIYFTTTGDSSLTDYFTSPFHWIVRDSTTYNDVRLDDTTEQYVYRDRASNDGWMTHGINGYKRINGLNWEDDIKKVRIDYEVMCQREDSNHAMENLRLYIYSSDGSYSYITVDSGTVSYSYWRDSYWNCNNAELLDDIHNENKYIQKVEFKVYVDGNWRIRWTRLWIDHIQIRYYINEDLS